MTEPSHILLVDDDRGIRALVSDFLRANGFRVTTAGNGAEMAPVLAQGAPDLIILDWMLPGVSGLDVCRDLRKTSSVPIIMLTARGEDIDRIIGLEMGADDYISKPFNPRELLARIHAVLRRARVGGALGEARLLHFAGWQLDTLKRELTNPAGVVVDLSTGEYDLLRTFVDAPQRVLSREYLFDRARSRDSDSFDRAMDVQISRLRRKIETSGEMIKTVRGAGYLFVPDVRRQSR